MIIHPNGAIGVVGWPFRRLLPTDTYHYRTYYQESQQTMLSAAGVLKLGGLRRPTIAQTSSTKELLREEFKVVKARLEGSTTLQLNVIPFMKAMVKARILYTNETDAKIMRENNVSSYHWRLLHNLELHGHLRVSTAIPTQSPTYHSRSTEAPSPVFLAMAASRASRSAHVQAPGRLFSRNWPAGPPKHQVGPRGGHRC